MKSGLKAGAFAHWTASGCLWLWVLLVGVGKACATLRQGGKRHWRVELAQWAVAEQFWVQRRQVECGVAFFSRFDS